MSLYDEYGHEAFGEALIDAVESGDLHPMDIIETADDDFSWWEEIEGGIDWSEVARNTDPEEFMERFGDNADGFGIEF